MQVDRRALLADALSAIRGIERRLAVYDLEQFLTDEDMRLIVERLFITLSEALNALSKEDSSVVRKVPALPTIIAFRNILVHRYRSIKPEIVYSLARNEAGALIATLEAMMTDLENS